MSSASATDEASSGDIVKPNTPKDVIRSAGLVGVDGTWSNRAPDSPMLCRSSEGKAALARDTNTRFGSDDDRKAPPDCETSHYLRNGSTRTLLNVLEQV